MGTVESLAGRIATRMRRKSLSETATDCSDTPHNRAARGLWPRKTAEEWAARAGVQPRMAAYWLAGTHAVSSDGKLALIRELD